MNKKTIINNQKILEEVNNLTEQHLHQQALSKLKEWCDRHWSKRSIPQEALIKLAELQLGQQDYEAAIETYQYIDNTTGSEKKKKILKLFNAASNAALSNNNQESAALHCQLLAVDPKNRHGLRNGAIVLKRLRALDTAEKWILRYLNYNPDCTLGLNTYGSILTELGRNTEAVKSFIKALDQDPNYPDANSNIANEYHIAGQIDPAYYYSSRSVFLSAERVDLFSDHLTQLRRVCHFNKLDKIDWWALFQHTTNENISAIFLQVLVLAEKHDDQEKLLNLVNKWGDHYSAIAAAQPGMPIQLERPKQNEPLRIGFVSPDFKDHSVARFIWPLFKNLDRKRYQLFAYSTFREYDQWRQRFEESADAIREVGHCSPVELQRIIQEDKVHVLFDLAGFTRGSRTSLLAWRCAPIQISWLGYPGSSGLPQMDYLFLDQYLNPTDPKLIREKALISPGTTVCFSEIPEIPITTTIPEIKRGQLTLGSLNNSYKITRSTIKRWSNVMNTIPTAQFLFVRREFESYYLRENILNEFKQHGIGSERIHFYNNRKANRHYLDCYNEIDFTLDTYPVTGGTTTTDSLWMGVPVVGLEGSNVHQRVCSAILHHAGHPEWIAKTDEEFIEIAVKLANNQQERIALRQSLRKEIKNSLLCDTEQFAKDFASSMEELRAELRNRKY